MSGVTGVGATSSAASATTSTDNASQLANAFSQGIVQFMGVELQNAENDTISSINDTTSDPDAPS